MKVYISIPYKYMAKVDYEEVYQEISERVKKKGDIPVLPDITDNRVIGETKDIIANHLKANIRKLMDCDAMIVSNFYTRSNICNIEMAVADEFSIDVQYKHRIKYDKIRLK